jgi:Ser/Thr protein kinase RdoA (MazF antagonist)
MFNYKSDCVFPNDGLKKLKDNSNEELGLTEQLIYDIANIFDRNGIVVSKKKFNSTFNRIFLVEDHPEYPKTCDSLIIRFTFPMFEGYESNLHLQQWASSEAILEQVKTPRIISTDTSHKLVPFDYQIIEYVEGKTLFEERHNEELVCSVLKEVSDELNKLHQIKMRNYGLVGFNLSKSWEHYLDTNFAAHIEYLEKHELADVLSIIMVYNDAISNLPLIQPKLLHGDLSYHNIIVKDGKLAAIIDWEDALFGDPIFDYANLATFHPERRHKIFIDNIPNKPADFYKRFWLYFLRISIAKAVSRHRFDIIDKPEEGHLAANDRIKLAVKKLQNG